MLPDRSPTTSGDVPRWLHQALIQAPGLARIPLEDIMTIVTTRDVQNQGQADDHPEICGASNT